MRGTPVASTTPTSRMPSGTSKAGMLCVSKLCDNRREGFRGLETQMERFASAAQVQSRPHRGVEQPVYTHL